MQIRATIIKLLNAYRPHEIIGHMADEIDQKAAHFETVEAPKKAAYLRREAAALRAAAYAVDHTRIASSTKVPLADSGCCVNLRLKVRQHERPQSPE